MNEAKTRVESRIVTPEPYLEISFDCSCSDFAQEMASLCDRLTDIETKMPRYYLVDKFILNDDITLNGVVIRDAVVASAILNLYKKPPILWGAVKELRLVRK